MNEKPFSSRRGTSEAKNQEKYEYPRWVKIVGCLHEGYIYNILQNRKM